MVVRTIHLCKPRGVPGVEQCTRPAFTGQFSKRVYLWHCFRKAKKADHLLALTQCLLPKNQASGFNPPTAPHPTHGLDRPWPRDAKRYETIHFRVDSYDDLVSTSPWTIPKRGSIFFLKQICQVNALFMNGQEYIYMH